MSGMHRATRQPQDFNDEFATVFHTQAAAASPAIASINREAPKTQLTEQQLFDRIEELLEQLDKKRLSLQQLLKSLRESPHSARLQRSLDGARVDAAKLARKVHNLFRFISVDSGRHERGPDDPTLLKFEPLFKTYAAVSQILNATCMESMRLEEELASRQAASSSGRRTVGSEVNRRKAATAASSASASASSSRASSMSHLPADFDASGSGGNGGLSNTTLASLDGDLMESMPLLEVNGLDTYEASRKQGDYMQLSSMVHDIALAFRTLQSVAHSQQENIDSTAANIDRTRLQAHAAEGDLRTASRYKALGTVLAGGAAGAALGGPLGAVLGLKTGLVSLGVGAGLAGVTGVLVGVTAAKTINRARFVPLSHQDEEHELQRIQKEGVGNAAHTDSAAAAAAAASVASTRSSSLAASGNNSPTFSASSSFSASASAAAPAAGAGGRKWT